MTKPNDSDGDLTTARKPHRERIPQGCRAQKKKSRLFSEENPSDPTASVTEWIIPSLRHWVLDIPTAFHEPVVTSPGRILPPSLRAGVQPSSIDGQSTLKQLGRELAPESVKRSTRYTLSDPSSAHRKTEVYLQGLGASGGKRFYRTDSVKNKLTGPENYFAWAEEVQTKLAQCHAWPLVEEEMTPTPMQSPFHTRWMQLNNKAWMLIISNVCREIRKDLCISWAWDTRGSWGYLREKYGAVTATMVKSVQSVQDLTSLRLENCASLREFLGKMKECIRAIECSRRGKEVDEWLWCQFILAKLGPQWESWTAEYLTKMRDVYGKGVFLGRVDRLLLDIEAEEARRVRVMRFSTLLVY